jgi:hypothetical protein
VETLESIRQDCKSFLLIKKENGARNPTISKNINNGVMEELPIWQKFPNLWASKERE